MTDLTETIARAVADDSGYDYDESATSYWDGLVKVALTAINAAGYAIVPREPTDAQLQAIADADFVPPPLMAFDHTEADRIVYRAAIAAGEVG